MKVVLCIPLFKFTMTMKKKNVEANAIRNFHIFLKLEKASFAKKHALRVTHLKPKFKII